MTSRNAICFVLTALICALLSTVVAAEKSQSFLMANHDLTSQVPNELMVVQYDPIHFSNKEHAKLKISMDGHRNRICLYKDAACSKDAHCTASATSFVEPRVLSSKQAFTVGLSKTRLAHLANPKHPTLAQYRCMTASLAYHLVDTPEKLAALSSHATYECQLDHQACHTVFSQVLMKKQALV